MSISRFLSSVALAATLVAPVAASAQQGPPPPAGAQRGPQAGQHRHGHHRNPMRAALAKLNLSDAQKSQIRDAMKQSREATKSADQATRKANREKLRAQIDGILSPDQRAQFRTELAQMRARHEAHQHHSSSSRRRASNGRYAAAPPDAGRYAAAATVMRCSRPASRASAARTASTS